MIRRLLKTLIQDRAGATSIEYAIIGGFLGVAIVACMGAIAPKLGQLFAQVSALFP